MSDVMTATSNVNKSQSSTIRDYLAEQARDAEYSFTVSELVESLKAAYGLSTFSNGGVSGFISKAMGVGFLNRKVGTKERPGFIYNVIGDIATMTVRTKAGVGSEKGRTIKVPNREYGGKVQHPRKSATELKRDLAKANDVPNTENQNLFKLMGQAMNFTKTGNALIDSMLDNLSSLAAMVSAKTPLAEYSDEEILAEMKLRLNKTNN